ncbi:ABC transporter ATP-binding protein [Cohnella xylanilytica]|uniref:ABC transporter ATP-binding protein n=1 Tax=Cohnella xylanilytica TaxID=557555 RepID=UPI001B2B83BB|nr:ABC transporter ATP-binding protein [Cohnella xylanilytica]GIO13706.1 ABC transporter ATP-binding protein [Cohnella xylanilytica]
MTGIRRTASPSTPALELTGLYKAFGTKVAVDRVDLTVPAGSFFGLVGPNGAGKTTTLSMATGLLRPDRGTARVFGVDMWRQPVRAKELIGVLPDGLAMPERLKGREALRFMGLLRGLPESVVAERSRELLAVLDLQEAAEAYVGDYSTGMRKKIALAVALLHAPKLLVLDEPFEAVDPLSASTIKNILRRFAESGGSVVFSSHVMETVEQLCDSLAVIGQGKVRAAGPMEAVRAGRHLEERFAELVGGVAGGKEGLTWLLS